MTVSVESSSCAWTPQQWAEGAGGATVGPMRRVPARSGRSVRSHRIDGNGRVHTRTVPVGTGITRRGVA